METKCDGVDKAENKGTEYDTNGTCNNFSASKNSCSDQKGSKCECYHTRSDINVDGLLILGKQAAGQSGEGICNTQTNDCCKYGIDRGRLYHNRIVSGSANCKTKSSSKKQSQKSNDNNDCEECDNQLTL